MTSALHFLTIAEASQQIKARTLSPLEYVDHLAQRIEAIDPQINSFITPTLHGHKRRKPKQRLLPEITVVRCTGFPSVPKISMKQPAS